MMAGGGGGEIPGLPGFRLTPLGQGIASGFRQPPTTPATVAAAVGDAAAVAPAAGPAAGAPLALADAPADHGNEVEAAGHGDSEPAASPKPKASKGLGGKVKMSIDEMAASFARKLKKDIVEKEKQPGSVCKRPAAAPSGTVMKKCTPAAAPSGTVMKKTKVGRRAWPLKYPGIPKAAKDAVTVGDFRLMTDVKRQQWRLRKIGERPDKAFSWKVDGSESWKRMGEYWQTV